MPDGQADSSAPGTLDDLAALLQDNPTLDPEHEAQPKEKSATKPGTEDDQAAGDDDTPDDDTARAPEDTDEHAGEPDEDEPERKAEDRTSERKIKVTTKGDDGEDVTRELSESEVVKGYMRQADYTRGKQELARKEAEAFELVTTHVQGYSKRYMDESAKQLATIQALAGLRSPEEMAILATQDPGEWVKEQQRERAISAVQMQIEQSMQAEKQRMEQHTQQLAQQQFQKAWGVLGQAGIDKPTLKTIFESIKTNYGIPDERFANINDPKLVFIMRDAAAYRALQDKKAIVTKKAQEAPRLPPQRQSVPRNERLAKQLDARFKGGKAKLDDLAAYFHMNKI